MIDFIWFLDNVPRWERLKHTAWFCGRFLAGFFPPQATNKKNTQNTKKAVILGWKKQRFEKHHMFFVFNRHGMSVASMQDVSIAASEDSWPAYLMVQWCKRWWWGQVFLLSSLNTSEENWRITISSSNLNKKNLLKRLWKQNLCSGRQDTLYQNSFNNFSENFWSFRDIPTIFGIFNLWCWNIHLTRQNLSQGHWVLVTALSGTTQWLDFPGAFWPPQRSLTLQMLVGSSSSPKRDARWRWKKCLGRIAFFGAERKGWIIPHERDTKWIPNFGKLSPEN